MTHGFDYWDLRTGEGLTDSELHERFDDMLDECYPDMPFNLTASEILKRADPIQYRVAFSEWLDSELGETLTDEELDEEEEEGELPDSCFDAVSGHWFVVTYGRAPYQTHAEDCSTCVLLDEEDKRFTPGGLEDLDQTY